MPLPAFALLALAPQVVTMATPPPAVVGPPSVVIHTVANRAAVQTLTFDVVVRRAGTLLWQGRLRTTSASRANFTQRVEESSACPRTGDRTNTQTSSSGIQITVSPAYGFDTDGIRLFARFDRPAEATPSGCDAPGTRTVEAQATLHPEPNRTFTLTADADYSVSLTLRTTG